MGKDTQAKQQTGLDHFMQEKQRVVAAVLVFVCMLAFGLFYWLNKPGAPKVSQKTQSDNFANPIGNASNSIWREQQENRIHHTETQALAVQTQLADLKDQAHAQMSLLKAQASELNRLHAQFVQTNLTNPQMNPKNSNNTPNTGARVFSAPGAGDNVNEDPSVGNINRRHIKISNFALTPHALTDLIHTDKNYVPAGAFVRAVLLSGLDAPTGVNNQAQPVPVLLRLVGWGKLPNDAYSHIKSCFMTAAGLGNISSERAYIRTERMSCTLKDGRILDVPIEATIVGPDGKDGVRGPVIWREQAMVERAAAAGLLSGFSNALSQAYTVQSYSPLGVTSTVNNKRIFQYGLANGASNGMDKLANYFISRAESYQPVVEVSAGITVDVMFLQGVSLALNQGANLSTNGSTTIGPNSASLTSNSTLPSPLFGSSNEN